MKKIEIAPGHVFSPEKTTGIEWTPKLAHLWIRGERMATEKHTTKCAYDFWAKLAFIRTFPYVEQWWFGSAWTQRVRIHPPAQSDDEFTYLQGNMQFVNDEEDPLEWTADLRAEPSTFHIPLPLGNHAANFPLRFALCRLVDGLISDIIDPEQWYLVTSLVQRDRIPLAIPRSNPGWQLEGLPASPREAFCTLLGLEPTQ
jgi:hypothetical protein